MENTTLKVEEVTKMVDVMRKADSTLSYLHHRGYIQYGKEICPNKDDVMNLVGELREIWEDIYKKYVEVKSVYRNPNVYNHPPKIQEIIHKCGQKIEDCKCEDASVIIK